MERVSGIERGYFNGELMKAYSRCFYNIVTSVTACFPCDTALQNSAHESKTQFHELLVFTAVLRVSLRRTRSRGTFRQWRNLCAESTVK
jgi:hypothetical protein